MMIADRRVLVTGATGGLGQAIARRLTRRGAALVLTGRRTEVLEPLAEELGARAIACDLSDLGEVERLACTAGHVDVLVANAGVPATGVLVDLLGDDINRMLDVNLRAPIALARALAPAMLERGSGHLVFVSSLAGKVASPASSVYSATKFGLRGFALGIRQDLGPHGVGVSVVFPGFIREAGMIASAEVELPCWLGTRTPDDVAAAVERAIEGNRAEVEVAPLGLSVGARIAGLAPELAATAMRRIGSARIATELAAAIDERGESGAEAASALGSVASRVRYPEPRYH
jgi:uncharacterized protein